MNLNFNKIKPANPIQNNNNMKNPVNKMPNIDNNKKKMGFFKEIAERELGKKEPSEEKKEQIVKKINNFGLLPAKNKEQINRNITKKEEQNGGLFIIPNFCEKKPKKPKEISNEKKEISNEIPQKDKKVMNSGVFLCFFKN